MSKEKSLELLTLAGNMLVDENAYNEYTNSTKYIGVDFLTKDVENAMNYLKTNSQGKTFLDMLQQIKFMQEILHIFQPKKDGYILQL